MTGQGSERPDKGKRVARPKKRQRQAPKYVLRVLATLPTTVAPSPSSVGPPPTLVIHPPPTPTVDPNPTPALHPSPTPTTDPVPPPMIISLTPPPYPTSIPSSSCIPPSETVTSSVDPDSAGDGEGVDPPLHDPPWIESYSKGFIPSRVASEAITRSIKQQFLSPWPTCMFINQCLFCLMLQMKVQWKPEHETQIQRNFHMKAFHRLSEMFRDARNIREHPYWLGEHIWNSLLAQWNSVEFRNKCAKAQRNRVFEKGGTLHTGGSITIHEHAIRMEEFSTRLSQVRSEHGSTPTPDDASNAEDDIPSRGGTLKHQPSSSTTIVDEAVVRLIQALEQRDQEITDLRAEFRNFKALVIRVLPETSQDQFIVPSTQPRPSLSPAVPQQPTSVQPSSV
ncbi:hypothetical protein LR48_Vigan11g052500 [Vigna angularis]|uniref:Uncharacterized protein n=1 Tax=Phaseolus angularis TaxID=3914 RepID=A0A0L9VRL5_PHAAN|nr:hypothetical protein LR48_Vigan11g052500 [Vigna angularis]